MDDAEIIALYLARKEQAIIESQTKYGSYCHTIAENIVGRREDADECVNSTYLAAWNAIPPHQPAVLRTFLGKLTRRISLDHLRHTTRQKRGGGEMTLVLEELADCVGSDDVETEIEMRELSACLTKFLTGLPEDDRDAFVCRYWHFAPMEKVAGAMGWSVSKTKSRLFRMRKQLGDLLEKEGYL